MDHKIILSRTHKPLPKKWIIKNQIQYATAQFLMDQESIGLKPSYLVSFHYYHPDEVKEKRIKFNEAKKEFDYALWNETAKDKFIRKRRLNEFDLIEDHKQIKNVILKELYGIKRLNKKRRYSFPQLLFFYEKGKSRVKFHTHLFLTKENLKYDDLEQLDFVFNNIIRTKRKCFSNWKRIDIEEVNNVRGALSYCNKETDASTYSLDYENSNLLTKNLL